MRALFSQTQADFRAWEDSLISLRQQAIEGATELARYQANEDFTILLEEVLSEHNAFKFTWDSVKNFSVLTAPDKSFKIFTWAIQKNDWTIEHFGFLHVYNENRKKYLLYSLNDKHLQIDYPHTFVGNPNDWYGAVYYKIIPLKTKTKTYYTLFGFNENDLFTNQKIIEVLSFRANGTPIFGATIFKKFPKKVSRVIFEYAKNSTFSLRYEPQSFDVSTGKRDPKTRRVIYETQTANMIIFQQLIPMEEGLESIPAYSVAEASLNQGFIADEGKWLFLPNVKGRNPDKKMPKYIIKDRQFYQP